MKLTEKHIIKANHSFFKECDELCFKSKNVYNSSLYYFRQNFIHNNDYKNYYETYYELRTSEAYQALPDKVSKQTLRMLEGNKSAFIRAIKDFTKNPSKYKGRPKLPKYKHKTEGRFVCAYERGSISKKVWIKEGKIGLSQTNIKINPYKATFDNICQVRIIPKKGYFIIELVYEVLLKDRVSDNRKYAAIDLGLSNLCTITFNEKGCQPIIINGNGLKSINQFYNKRKAELQSKLKKEKTSKQLRKIALKRNNKINNQIHKISSYIVNQIVSRGVSKLVIGYNPEWKQGINIGKKNNQNFVNIPFKKLTDQLQYKLDIKGVELILREESYTSKCSFLDLEDIKKKEKYCGYRKSRGIYKSYEYGVINADVNGSYNIMRKAFPDIFMEGIEGIAVCPVRVNVA